MDTKTCSKCHQEKLLSDFYKDKSKSDGLTPDCKECRRKKTKKQSSGMAYQCYFCGADADSLVATTLSAPGRRETEPQITILCQKCLSKIENGTIMLNPFATA